MPACHTHIHTRAHAPCTHAEPQHPAEQLRRGRPPAGAACGAFGALHVHAPCPLGLSPAVPAQPSPGPALHVPILQLAAGVCGGVYPGDGWVWRAARHATDAEACVSSCWLPLVQRSPP